MDWWDDVERALRDVPHAVAGAVATNAYAPERATRDIDVVVAAASADRAENALHEAGWRKTGELSVVRGSSWQDATGHELALIALTHAWGSEAIRAAQKNRIAGMSTVPLSYLVLMKLMASRTIDLADISRMLGRAGERQVEQVRQVVMRFGHADDVADLDQLVRMGRLERGAD